MGRKWEIKIAPEVKEFIAEIALANEGKVMTRDNYFEAARAVYNKFELQWSVAKAQKVFSLIRTEYKIKAGRGGIKGVQGRKKSPVFDNLKDEIAALVTCFTEKLLKAAEKHNAKNKDKLAEMEKEISELKAELRELKNIRESVERYQSRYVKR